MFSVITIVPQMHEESVRDGKETLVTRKSKRPYGTGYLKQEGQNWVMRWRETQIGADGSRKRVLRFESLGPITRKEATAILTQRIAITSSDHKVMRSRLTFATLAQQWKATVLPMYKLSTRKCYLHILDKRLIPRFGEFELSKITRQEIQAYIAQLTSEGNAPKSIDHYHDVLSAVLRTAVKWGHLPENIARGVDLPPQRSVRPKFALTPQQAAALLNKLPPLAKTMVALDLLTGLRRGEIFALRWKDIDWEGKYLKVDEAVYDGSFDTPKTEAGNRMVPLSDAGLTLLSDWQNSVSRTGADDLIFCTRTGQPISPNNLIRRCLMQACDELGLPHVTWLTFRRTYSSWSHDKGVPAKVTAQIMGHTNVDVTLNIYTQVMDDSLRNAAERVGQELFSIVQSDGKEAA